VDANPFAYLTHLGSAAAVGLAAEDWGDRLTGDGPVPLFRSVFRLRCPDAETLRRHVDGTGRLWWLGPSTRPADAAAVLTAAGVPRVDAVEMMDADLDSVPAPPTVAGVRIVEAGTPAELAGWAAARAAANGEDPAAERLWLTVVTQLGIGALRHFIAVRDDTPIASASIFTGAGIAGLYNVGTVPQARGQGIGTAITLVALAAARRDGHRRAMLGAEPPAAGLYRRIGFRNRAIMPVHRG
jgi:GNAT superfamily N-acetyltransferase